MKLLVLVKLFRLRPTIAWAVCGSLLGISIAIHEYGLELNWLLLALAFVMVVLIQAFLSHAINDISDVEVDKITDLEGTGRYKVLVSGISTKNELSKLAYMVLIISFLIIYNLYSVLGWKVLIFAAVGVYAPLAYSLEPFKLGWKPFSEWTIVFPLLLCIVIGVNFVATGSISFLAVVAGVIFALYNIVWFLISRIMDYEPDKKAGKITTIVQYPYTNPITGINLYLERISFLLFFISVIAMVFISYIFVVSLFLSYFSILLLPNGYNKEINYSDSRVIGIYLSIINSILLSVVLIIT